MLCVDCGACDGLIGIEFDDGSGEELVWYVRARLLYAAADEAVVVLFETLMVGEVFCSAVCARNAAKKFAKKGRFVVGIVSEGVWGEL